MVEKFNKLKNNHYVVLSNRIKQDLKESYVEDIFQENFTRIEKLIKEPLKLAVFGEFNAGKTTFINRLLGLSLPTKRVPTTKVITTIKYAPSPKFEIEYKDKNSGTEEYSVREYEGLEKLNQILESDNDLIEIKEVRVYLPNPILKTFEIIDTPGFNDLEFEGVTKTLFDKVNFAIWIFSAQQAGSGTEREVLQEFTSKSPYKNNIYAFINQADIVDEQEIEHIKEGLREYQEFFMNKDILAISAKRKEPKWEKAFEKLKEDLKFRVLNRDMEISENQLAEEFKLLKEKLGEVKQAFLIKGEKIKKGFQAFLDKYSLNSSKGILTNKMVEQIKASIVEIKNEVKNNPIYKQNFLKRGIEFVAFYKTIGKLEVLNLELKKIYINYIEEFQKEYTKSSKQICQTLLELPSKKQDFYSDIYKKFDKVLFTLDMLKETKELLIVGYITGILTDNYIYKNLKELDILRNINWEVVENLINLDLNISYFLKKIGKIEVEIENFFNHQLLTLEKALQKE